MVIMVSWQHLYHLLHLFTAMNGLQQQHHQMCYHHHHGPPQLPTLIMEQVDHHHHSNYNDIKIPTTMIAAQKPSHHHGLKMVRVVHPLLCQHHCSLQSQEHHRRRCQRNKNI
ncbi:hypothetical protein K492DRAFT_38473 [Lichtheimia hyalospora FSU 10163]|nr:hypothetical protein K492DRAFT_38473 [Lichtheimia hyalospora FSU 10163]